MSEYVNIVFSIFNKNVNELFINSVCSNLIFHQVSIVFISGLKFMYVCMYLLPADIDMASHLFETKITQKTIVQ